MLLYNSCSLLSFISSLLQFHTTSTVGFCFLLSFCPPSRFLSLSYRFIKLSNQFKMSIHLTTPLVHNFLFYLWRSCFFHSTNSSFADSYYLIHSLHCFFVFFCFLHRLLWLQVACRIVSEQTWRNLTKWKSFIFNDNAFRLRLLS